MGNSIKEIGIVFDFFAFTLFMLLFFNAVTITQQNQALVICFIGAGIGCNIIGLIINMIKRHTQD